MSSTSTSTASELIRQLTQYYNVSKVFGIPGVHTLELYRALNTTELEHITPRHEQGAGFMADGYARVSGQPGVCFIISGPGMTNIITAMGQAYSESIPMLVISSVNKHGRMGSGDGWLHELHSQQTLVNGVCAFSHTVHHPSEVTQVLARAFAVFDSQRPRPVHLEIPINVLNAPYSRQTETTPAIARLKPPSGHVELVNKAAQILDSAKQLVLLVGGGATHASASVAALSQRLDAPVVMSVNARGVMPHDHPLAVSASASLSAVRELISTADAVLGIGTEMGSTDYDFYEDGQLSIPAPFIRIDIDPQQLMRNHPPQLGIVGDSQTTLVHLLGQLQLLADKKQIHLSAHAGLSSKQSGKSRTTNANTKILAGMSPLERIYIETLTTVRDTLDGVVIVGDSTQLIYAGNSAFGAKNPSSWFNSATGFGTLGYALPAAIGASVADPHRPIVAISGDGGLQFCLGELATAVDAEVNLTLIVHENGGYNEISTYMQSQDIVPVGVDILTPDLRAIAAACGWYSQTLNTLGELAGVLETAHSDRQVSSLIVIPDALFHDALA